MNRKKHWETVYETKQPQEVSWTQDVPKTSLDFIHSFNISKTDKIIDIGGGDSKLVDFILAEGFENITVLDISEKALERAKKRLGNKAEKVKWIVADAANFKPEEKYDFWHDRAAFHFLTNETDIENYIYTVKEHLTDKGVLVVGTFSENGPKKCSGLEIKQYSEKSMTEKLQKFFEKVRCITVDHKTPFDTIQNFIFCSFKKLKTI